MTTLHSALDQTWPPFVIVTGLLLIGQVAAADGLFASIGSSLARLPGGGRVLFLALMGLVAIVTVVLNLDTSIVFLTPIVLHSARARRIDDRAFLYGAIFMTNSASLLLPGSNLTNLLVLSSFHVTGARFALAMLPAWCASVLVTVLVIGLWQWRALGQQGAMTDEREPFIVGPGLFGVLLATLFILILAKPALPIFLLGILLLVFQRFATHRMTLRATLRTANLELLLGLFLVAVASGVIARTWDVPHRLMHSIGPWETMGIAAGVTDLVNNLPAAVLFSSQRPAHPGALLIGLDLGPNLVVIGAMSSLLWFRIAKTLGARPSIRTFSLLGMILTPISAVIALVISEQLVLGHL